MSFLFLWIQTQLSAECYWKKSCLSLKNKKLKELFWDLIAISFTRSYQVVHNIFFNWSSFYCQLRKIDWLLKISFFGAFFNSADSVQFIYCKQKDQSCKYLMFNWRKFSRSERSCWDQNLLKIRSNFYHSLRFMKIQSSYELFEDCRKL